MLTYRLRAETTAIVLHDSHTPPSQSDVQNFLAVGGREKGLLDIGYHFLILRDGQIIECRPMRVQGTHLRSKRNRDTIGVCLAGGAMKSVCPWPIGDCPHPNACACDNETLVPRDNFTPAQWSTLTQLLHTIRGFYGPLPLLGHSEIDKNHRRSCPPVDMMEVRDRCLVP